MSNLTAPYKGRDFDIAPWLYTVAAEGLSRARELADAVGCYGPYEVRFPARAFLAMTDPDTKETP